MIRISEWLPNPEGADSAGEWIEIENTATSAVSLMGFALEAGGKRFSLAGTLPAESYRVIPRSESRLTLRNQNDRVALIGPGGRVAESVELIGTAPEGRSFARIGESFAFATPTPRTANPRIEIAPAPDLPPILRPGLASPAEIAASVLLGGLAVAFALFFLIIHNHDLRELLCGRDEEDRLGSRGAHP